MIIGVCVSGRGLDLAAVEPRELDEVVDHGRHRDHQRLPALDACREWRCGRGARGSQVLSYPREECVAVGGWGWGDLGRVYWREWVAFIPLASSSETVCVIVCVCVSVRHTIDAGVDVDGHGEEDDKGADHDVVQHAWSRHKRVSVCVCVCRCVWRCVCA